MNNFLKAVKNIAKFSIIILACGCAGSYRTVDPTIFAFSNEQVLNDTLKVSHLKNIQALSRNKRYSKKEKKRNMSAVTVKMENISNDTIVIKKENIKIYVNDKEVSTIPVEVYTQKVKQTVPLYLLHALWGPWSFSYQEDLSTGRTETHFRILPIGAVVGIANSVVAATANARHKETLEKFQIFKTKISPGKTKYCILLIPLQKEDSLKFVLNP